MKGTWVLWAEDLCRTMLDGSIMVVEFELQTCVEKGVRCGS